MDLERNDGALIERKLARRGLLAGLAALGAAAALRATVTDKAQAADGATMIVGNDALTGDTETRLTMNVAVETPAFAVVNGGGATGFKSAVAGISSGLGRGILGINVDGAAGFNGVGVHGISASQAGVKGTSTNGWGVIGLADLFGTAVGVEGRSPNAGFSGMRGINVANGNGIKGVSNAGSVLSDGDGAGIGVHGRSGTGIGVQGDSQGGVGLRGVSNTHVGLVGISNTSIGLYGFNQTSNVAAFFAENIAPSGNRIAGIFNGNVTVNGNFTVSGGAKAAGVTMADGTQGTMYCQESPEPYFEDFGRAQLTGGAARVQLEPEFASLVLREGYFVYLTPEGECKGLAVVRRDAQAFEVRELQGGASTTPFSYRVVARRKDIPGGRLARIDTRAVANAAAVSRAMQAQSPFAPGAFAPSPSPVVPAPALPESPTAGPSPAVAPSGPQPGGPLTAR